MITRRKMLGMLAGIPALLVLGCEGNGERASCKAVQLHDEHDCALCGMTVVAHPGPKGQVCLRDGEILPFCSTGDLLSWAWQPESAPSIEQMYVHDLSLTGWDSPGDDAWMDAEEAWYVVGHERRGAMGKPPAPFSVREDAEAFAGEHGGRVYTYRDLDWDIIRPPEDGGPH